MTSPYPATLPRPAFAFVLLGALLAVLLVAGGASRGTVSGQVIVRCASWLILVIAAMTLTRRPNLTAVPLLLLAGATLAFSQLIPLPTDLWTMIPGRSDFTEAAAAVRPPQGSRVLSMVPGATINAVSSLAIPFATWLLVASLPDRERKWLPGLTLLLVAISALVGLLQFSGTYVDNPFINDTRGEVAGTFANRNHFALLLAMGSLIAPVWGFMGRRQSQWQGVSAWGLVLLFMLTILASGSRAGLGLGLAGFLLGLALSYDAMRRALSAYPRWVLPVLIAVIVSVIAVFVSVSVLADRAVSINRLFALDQAQDMRSRGLPVVISMIADYAPFGSGLGTFDGVFRIDEPFGLLKPTYFNQAHNDYLEIVLNAGFPGLLLLVCGIGWWLWASVRAWRGGPGKRTVPRLGSAMLFLELLASFVDYPARTPMIMAITVIAAVWLSGCEDEPSRSALPQPDKYL